MLPIPLNTFCADDVSSLSVSPLTHSHPAPQVSNGETEERGEARHSRKEDDTPSLALARLGKCVNERHRFQPIRPSSGIHAGVMGAGEASRGRGGSVTQAKSSYRISFNRPFWVVRMVFRYSLNTCPHHGAALSFPSSPKFLIGRKTRNYAQCSQRVRAPHARAKAVKTFLLSLTEQ